MKTLIVAIATLLTIGIGAEALGDAGTLDAGLRDAGAAVAPVPDPATDPGGYLSRALDAVKSGWGVPAVAILVIGLLGAIKKWWLPELKGNAARGVAFLIAGGGAVAHALATDQSIDWPLIQAAVTVGVAAITMHTATKAASKK